MTGPLILLTNPRELAVAAPHPIYPSEAIAHDLRGNGIFRLHVDLRNGTVRRIEVERSAGTPLFNRAASAALQKWQFKPPLIRQMHQSRDAENTSGEIVFRVPMIFAR
jgi:TonB family protein